MFYQVGQLGFQLLLGMILGKGGGRVVNGRETSQRTANITPRMITSRLKTLDTTYLRYRPKRPCLKSQSYRRHSLLHRQGS